MENMVPAAGRILRYWCGALATRCHTQLVDLLGLEEQLETKTRLDADDCWASAEVWSQPEPGHEATIILPASKRQKVPGPRVRMCSNQLEQPAARRPGTIVSATFGSARSRLTKARAQSRAGFI